MNIFSWSQPANSEGVVRFRSESFYSAFGDRCCGSIREIVVDESRCHICFIASQLKDFNHHSFFIETVIRRLLNICDDTALSAASSFRYYCDDAAEGTYEGLFAGPFIVNVFKTGEWWNKESGLPNFVSLEDINSLTNTRNDGRAPGLFDR